MSNSKPSYRSFVNQFGPKDAFERICFALVSHPFDYIKMLIQLGYEPLPPHPTKTIFGRHRLALPGVFSYMSYVRRTDGLFGLYRGLSYKLVASLTYGFVHDNISHMNKKLLVSESTQTNDQQIDDQTVIDVEKLKKLLLDLSRETLSRFAALCVSYPFQLMTVRVCAQFVGKEHHYDSILSAVTDVYQTGGVLGFYSGFVPRFLGDCLILWCGSTFIFLVDSFIDRETGIRTYVNACINFILASVLYPFQLVSTVMCCNGWTARSLLASSYTGPEYLNWIDCWKNLSNEHQLKRGSSLIWRYTSGLKQESANSQLKYLSF